MKKNRDINKLVREMETLFVFWSDQKLPAPPPVPPPARPEDVESRQEAIQFEFPPSYRLFLSLHNGWVGMEKWDVFGVSGMAWDRLHAQYDEDLSYFETQYQKRGGAKYVAKIRAAEKKKNDDVMYLPDHVPCAVTAGRFYAAFDRHRVGKDREYPIALVGTGDNVHIRYDNFAHFLEVMLGGLSYAVAELGHDPAKLLAGK